MLKQNIRRTIYLYLSYVIGNVTDTTNVTWYDEGITVEFLDCNLDSDIVARNKSFICSYIYIETPTYGAKERTILVIKLLNKLFNLFIFNIYLFY